MDTIKIEKKNVKMIAHRGLSGLEKENTHLAFVAAGNKSYFGIETDVHLTKDGIFVISHDFNTERVTGVGLNIKDTLFSDLRNLSIYDFDSNISKPYIKFPTLKEYLEICKKYEKHCIIEVKPEFNGEEINKLLEEVNSVNELKNTTFISFNLENLKKIREINPTIPLQYLSSTYNDDLLNICKTNNLDIDIYYKELTIDAMKKFKDNNIKVNAWTVNSESVAIDLVSWGIDYITTNILE